MYTHLIRDDRAVISNGLRRGESYSEISEHIGKDKGAVWREVRRNKDPDGIYRVWSADRRAKEKRKYSKVEYRKIENSATLRRGIEAELDPLVSPEVVAHEVGVVHETIYAWIYRSRPDLKAKLPRFGKKRRKYGSKRGKKQGWTANVRSIDERVEEDENWEGDTVRGSTSAGLLTHVERSSLFTAVDHLGECTADLVHEKISSRNLTGTITYDRGGEFALWKMIEEDTDALIYFAHPRHPWERGKNENTNERLRRRFPKGFDFGTIKQRDVDRVVWKMNHTPRKSLSWRTPCEVYGKCCSSR